MRLLEFISALFSRFSVGESSLPVCAWRILFLFLFPQMTSAHSYGLVQREQEQQLHSFCQLDKLHLWCCWCMEVAWAGESQLCWFPPTSGHVETLLLTSPRKLSPQLRSPVLPFPLAPVVIVFSSVLTHFLEACRA